MSKLSMYRALWKYRHLVPGGSALAMNLIRRRAGKIAFRSGLIGAAVGLGGWALSRGLKRARQRST
jgi:hypothetical protein